MTNPLPHLSVCTNCGNFVNQLDDVTGWCSSCSKVTTINATKFELSLASNAGAIEFYLHTSTNSIYQALSLARQDRPVCVVCGNRIQRAGRNAIFCRKTAECRRYSRRYVYLYAETGLTKVEALAKILNELTGE